MILFPEGFPPRAAARSPLKTVHWTVFLALRTPPDLLRRMCVKYICFGENKEYQLSVKEFMAAEPGPR